MQRESIARTVAVSSQSTGRERQSWGFSECSILDFRRLYIRRNNRNRGTCARETCVRFLRERWPARKREEGETGGEKERDAWERGRRRGRERRREKERVEPTVMDRPISAARWSTRETERERKRERIFSTYGMVRRTVEERRGERSRSGRSPANRRTRGGPVPATPERTSPPFVSSSSHGHPAFHRKIRYPNDPLPERRRVFETRKKKRTGGK